jgi:hypothetical protein
MAAGGTSLSPGPEQAATHAVAGRAVDRGCGTLPDLIELATRPHYWQFFLGLIFAAVMEQRPIPTAPAEIRQPRPESPADGLTHRAGTHVLDLPVGAANKCPLPPTRNVR